MPEQEWLQGAQLMLYPYLHITIQHSFNTKFLLNGRWADYYKSEGLVRGWDITICGISYIDA